jgi:hypothetical protein
MHTAAHLMLVGLSCVAVQSPEVGRFLETLGFDVLGGESGVSLPLSGVCDYPHISADYRNVFYRKVIWRQHLAALARSSV